MTSRSDMKKVALIDSDILVYRIGFTTEDVDEGIAKWRLAELVERIVFAIEATDHRHYLTSSDKSNFRYQLFPEYKSHRVKPKPKHYDFLRGVLLSDYNAIEVFGQEADDAIGIACTEDPSGTVICTIDKDLDQIPGRHFNFVKEREYTITPIEAHRSFYEQILVGDKSTDNIEGCPGIGKVGANKRLEGCRNEKEMFEVVVEAYANAYDEEVWADRLLLAGNLLWIRKEPNQVWCLGGVPVSKTSLETSLPREESSSTMSLSPSNM